MSYKSRLLSLGLAVGFYCLSANTVYAAELQLAGIRLGRSAVTIVKKYGNPSQVIVGQMAQTQTTAPGAAYGAPQSPSGGLFPGLMSMGSSAMSGLGLDEFSSPSMMGNRYAGAGSPFGPQAGQPGMTAVGQPIVQKAVSPEVLWVYNFQQNKRLQFTINPDGVVVQIEAWGVDWSNIRTSKGITFGNTYKDLLLKYGYPESHEQSRVTISGVVLPVLYVKYPEKHRAIFTCSGKTIVGITIGLMD